MFRVAIKEFLCFAILNSLVWCPVLSLHEHHHGQGKYIPHLGLVPGKESVETAIDKFYTFNITNPDEVERGEYPIVKEVGPFVYKEIRTKFDIKELNDSVISYRLRRTYYFAEELSEGHKESERFNLINLPFLTVGSILQLLGLPKAFNDILIEELVEKNESLIIRNVSWGDYHFHGINASIYEEMLGDFGDVPPEFEGGTFSVFKTLNGTANDEYLVQSSGDRIGDILAYNGNASVNFWIGDKCNKIEGTDGFFFRPNITENTILKSFDRGLCRNAALKFTGKKIFKDVPVDVFKYDDTLLDNGAKNKDNLCYCSLKKNETEPTCLPPGILETSGCYKDAPLLLSRPHFMGVEEDFLNRHLGMYPDPSKHESEYLVEPVTGTILSFIKKFQLSYHVKPYENVEYFKNLTTMIIPGGWIDYNLLVPNETITEVKDYLTHKIDQNLYDHDHDSQSGIDFDVENNNKVISRRMGLPQDNAKDNYESYSPRANTASSTSSSTIIDIVLLCVVVKTYFYT